MQEVSDGGGEQGREARLWKHLILGRTYKTRPFNRLGLTSDWHLDFGLPSLQNCKESLLPTGPPPPILPCLPII